MSELAIYANAIAAAAQALANKASKGQLWPGQAEQYLAQIQQSVNDAFQAAKRENPR